MGRRWGDGEWWGDCDLLLGLGFRGRGVDAGGVVVHFGDDESRHPGKGVLVPKLGLVVAVLLLVLLLQDRLRVEYHRFLYVYQTHCFACWKIDVIGVGC